MEQTQADLKDRIINAIRSRYAMKAVDIAEELQVPYQYVRLALIDLGSEERVWRSKKGLYRIGPKP